MGETGFVNSITQKLNDLASGCWDPKDQLLAGTKHQRKSLKVPVAQTECGQNTFILWQIATGMDVETEVPQQEITGMFIFFRPNSALIINSVGSMRLS